VKIWNSFCPDFPPLLCALAVVSICRFQIDDIEILLRFLHLVIDEQSSAKERTRQPPPPKNGNDCQRCARSIFQTIFLKQFFQTVFLKKLFLNVFFGQFFATIVKFYNCINYFFSNFQALLNHKANVCFLLTLMKNWRLLLKAICALKITFRCIPNNCFNVQNTTSAPVVYKLFILNKIAF
jgi:hypothetical protein